MANNVVIPLSNIPAQKIRVVLDEQNCTISVYQRGEYMYMDLVVDTTAVMTGRLCLVNVDLVQYNTPYFEGSLFFVDTSGGSDIPNWSEFGSRYILTFVPAVD